MTRYYLRLVIWMIAVIVLSVVAVSAIFSGLQEKYFRPDMVNEMGHLSDELAGRLEGMGGADLQAELAAFEEKTVFQLEVVEQLPETGGDAALDTFFIKPAGASYYVKLVPDPVRVEQLQKEQGFYFLISLIAVGAIVTAAALFMILPLLRKLRAQERTILKIAEGDLDARAPVGSKDALGQLGNRINQMADRIKELLAAQRELLHAVSHEMRTPAARIGFALDMLEDAGSEEELKRRVASMHEDLAELDGLLEELLTFLRFDERNDRFETEEVEVAPMLEEIAGKASALREGVTITVSAPAGIFAQANTKYLRRVVENLVRNAARHAEREVRIEATSAPDTGAAMISVEDDGAGVPEPQRERVFEPFVRLDTSRDRRSGGAGLGLAIARRIVDRYGGEIAVTAGRNLKGARFVVLLPSLAEPPGAASAAGGG